MGANASIQPMPMVSPPREFSVVRYESASFFKLAPIASFDCPDGSVFVQEIRQGQGQTNDGFDGLTLTLHAPDGKRYRFPPFVHPFPKSPSNLSRTTDDLERAVMRQARIDMYMKWFQLQYSLRVRAQRQLVNSVQNIDLGP